MKKSFKTRMLCVSVALAFAGTATLAGCSSADYTMGTQSQDATTVTITNDMGKSIIGIAVKESAEKSYGDVMEPKDSMLADASTTVYFDIADTSKRYDVKIDCDDGSLYELHKIKLANVQDATLKVEGQIAYAVYTSKATGKEINTLEKEKGLIESKKKAEEEATAKAAAKKAAKAAAKKKAAEEAAAKKAAEEASQVQQQQSNESYSSSSSDNSNNKSSAASDNKKTGSSDSKASGSKKKEESSSKKSSESAEKPSKPASSNDKPSTPSSKDDPSCTDDILLK